MSKNKFKKFVEQVKADGKIKESVKYVEHNGKKYIVDGHHRVMAAKKAGIKDIPIEKVELPIIGRISTLAYLLEKIDLPLAST